MKGLGRGEHRRLEARLRKDRPRPGDELVHEISARVHEGRRGTGSFRLAFAGALTAAVVGALASVGGVSYAATAMQEAVEAVKRAVAPQGAIAVSGITSGRDQYRPGYGWGDPNHNHTGPPGICRGTANPPDRANTPGCPPAALAPPLQARRTNDGLAAVVRTTVTISEQASLSIAVVDRAGKKLLLTQSSRRGGSTVGQGVEGPQTKVIRYQMLVPRALPVQLRIPVNLLRPGQLYRIVIQATDPQGNRRAITIPFRLTS